MSGFTAFLALSLIFGCGGKEPGPVDLFPEDECALCRMAVSDHRFASEILLEDGSALKFDDLSCLMEYRDAKGGSKTRAIFVKDYDSKEWIPFDKAVIVPTGMHTPMGSGLVAARSSARAEEIVKQYPVKESR